MPENSSNTDVIPLEIILADEYKTALIKYHYLDGFGPGTIFDEIADINDEKDPKIQSNQYDPNFGDFYFASLGSAEANMIAFGMNNSSDRRILFSTLRAYVNDVTNQQLLKLPKGSSFLCEESRFVQAWYDEMMRASIRGLRKAGCEIIGLPLQYSEQTSIVVSRASPAESSLDAKIDSLAKTVDAKMELSAKYSSRFRKYVLAGIAGLYFTAAVAGIASFVFVQNAKKQLKDKEQEWELKINDRTNLAYVSAERVINEKIDSFISMYAPDVGKDLPLEQRLPLVFAQLKADSKKELIDTMATDVMPIVEARIEKMYGRQLTQEEMNIIAEQVKVKFKEMIESGEIDIMKVIMSAGKKEKKD